MPTTLTLLVESTTGERREALRIDLPEPSITARELIRTRVFEEVRRHNRVQKQEDFRGLVTPNRGPDTKKLDWHEQVEVALDAFRNNGILLLVDDRQVTSLEEEIHVREDTLVSFLRLVPLVGG